MDPFEKLRRPELFLQELLSKYAAGSLVESSTNSRVFYRATVISVDPDGGKLSNETGTGSVSIKGKDGKTIEVQAVRGLTNPKNSIKARIITRGFDRFIGNDDLRVFWPLFQEHMSAPIVPGEHVYVAFEDENFEHGFWVARVPGHQGVNQVIGSELYNRGNSKTAADEFDTERETEELTDDYLAETLLTKNLNDSF